MPIAYHRRIFFGFLGGLLIMMTEGQAFTLHPSRLRFSSDRIALIGSSNNCNNAGISAAELLDVALQAAEGTWNQVSTADMLLEKSGIISADTSADTLSQAAAKGRINAILIGCSSDTTLFDSASTLAVGSIGSTTNGNLGIVLVNDALVGGVNRVATLPRNQLEAVLAHEIGHALGIGHSSDPVALMYYSIGGKNQENLTQDDWDALTYLYPHDHLPGSCGTIEQIGPIQWNGSLFAGLLLALFLMGLLQGMRRRSAFYKFGK